MSGGGSLITTGISDIDKITANRSTAFGEYSVSENIANFNVHFPYNINYRLVFSNLTNLGSVSQANNLGEVHSGADVSSSAELYTVDVLEYQPGMGALFRGSVLFDTPKEGNNQFFGIGDSTEGLFFGYQDQVFGIFHKKIGANTFIPQSSWKIDKFDGSGKSGITLDPTKGNVFQIKYHWSGFGMIRFYIENPETGFNECVHYIEYGNTYATPFVSNPSFSGFAYSENTTNATDVVLKVGCFSGFVEGKISNSSYLRNSTVNSKSIATTETNIMTIRCNETFSGVPNRVRLEPDLINIATDGNKTFLVNLYANATLGGTPNFIDIDSDTSIASVDTAGTTITGGIPVASFVVAKIDSIVVTIRDYNTILAPRTTLTFAAITSGAGDVDISCSWQERFT